MSSKPLLLHNSEVYEGPLVAVNGLCSIEASGFTPDDEVEIYLYRSPLGSAQLIDSVARLRYDASYDLGNVRGWLQAIRTKSSGSRVSVFVKDISGVGNDRAG